MACPVSTEPVNETAATSGEPTIASPTTAPRPITRLNTPGGTPASSRILASAQAQPGTRSAALNTTQLP